MTRIMTVVKTGGWGGLFAVTVSVKLHTETHRWWLAVVATMLAMSTNQQSCITLGLILRWLTNTTTKHTHTHIQPFYCSSGICPRPPGWAGTRKVKPGRLKPIWIYWSKRYWVAVASAGLYATLTPFDLQQGLPLRATHGFTCHSTHRRVPPCMAQSRLGAFPR